MGLLTSLFGERNPIDSMSIDDLKVTEIQLTKKIEDIYAEVRRIDLEVQRIYDLAKGVISQSEEVSYARRIKTLLQKKEAKVSNQAQLEKELRAISNIIILKEREKDIPSNVLRKLKSVDPDQLERWLIGKKLDTMNKDAQIDTIIDMTSSTIEIGVEQEEDLADILDTIRASKEQTGSSGKERSDSHKKELE